jgi:RimJ/RimL family protein N-acetyltransferase
MVDAVLNGSPVRTERLLLRCWQPSDASLLKTALDSSLDHLRPWMSWAIHEPSDLAAIAARLADFRSKFIAGTNWGYGIFDPAETEVLGSAGLHPRIQPGALEIGYWLRADMTGKGLATEAVWALTGVGFNTFHANQIEIHCDPNNIRSLRVPQRLHYLHIETRIQDSVTPTGAPRDTMIWSLKAAEYAAIESAP